MLFPFIPNTTLVPVFFHAKKIKSKGSKIATSATVVRLHAGHGRGENSPASESVVKELNIK